LNCTVDTLQLALRSLVLTFFQLSFARSPTSSKRIYARDCPIHIHLTLESQESQLLDLISPSSISITLVQHIEWRSNQQQIRALAVDPSSSASPQMHTVHLIYKHEADADYDEVVTHATCWGSTASEKATLAQRRYFEAEIVVRKDLKPSFTFPMFSLQVCKFFFPHD